MFFLAREHSLLVQELRDVPPANPDDSELYLQPIVPLHDVNVGSAAELPSLVAGSNGVMKPFVKVAPVA